MTPSRRMRTIGALTTAALLLTACGGDDDPSTPGAEGAACADVDLSTPPAQPVAIRIGHGVAAEEPFWTMLAHSDVLEHEGSWYTIDNEVFRATEDRFVAFQAGQLDAITTAPNGLYPAIAQGLDLAAVAAIMNEGGQGFSTTFVTRVDEDIDGPADLRGKTVAIPDLNTLQHMGVEVGVVEAGLDPSTDVEYVVLPFPAQGEAVVGGTVDVAGLPEPFFTMAMATGQVKPVFTINDVMGFDFPLLLISFSRAFVENNTEVVCAWVEDFGTAMAWYKSNRDEAREILQAQEFVALPLELYLQTNDYDRPDLGAIDLDALVEVQDRLVELGLLEAAAVVDREDMIIEGVTVLTD